MANLFVYQYNGNMYSGETEVTGDPMDQQNPYADLNQLYEAEINERIQEAGDGAGAADVNENYAVLRT